MCIRDRSWDAEKIELLRHVFGVGDGHAKAEGFHLGEIENATVEFIDNEPGALLSSLDIELAQLRSFVVLLSAIPGQACQVSSIVDSVVVQRCEKLEAQGIPESKFIGDSIVKEALNVDLSLIHISEPTRRLRGSRMPSSA